jgi:hypothetical protein
MPFYTETISTNHSTNTFLSGLKAFGRGLKAFGRGTWNFLESAGRARAAAEFARMGRHDLARNIMLGDK